jgi:hypothetical protein
MPRDAVLLSPTGVNLEAVLRAAAAVDEQLQVRSLYDGAALQLFGADGQAVITVQHSTLIANAHEIERLLPSAPAVHTPLWWSEVYIPWRSDGQPGLDILYRLAVHLGATLVLEDAS